MALGAAVCLFGLWSIAAPEGHGHAEKGGPILRADIEAAARYSTQHQGLALLVWRHKMLFERYDNGAKRGDKNKIYSVVKSVWGLAAAAAVDEGILAWDEKVADTLTEWKDDPRKSQVTVAHLLSMSSGIDPGYLLIDDDKTLDKLSPAVGLPALSEPGTVFTYGPANMSLFGELLRRKLKPRSTTPMRYLSTRVLSRLGIKGGEWGFDKAGNPMMASGVTLDGRQLLAIGRAFLDGTGRRGRPIVKPSTLEAFEEGSAANPMYSLALWLNAQARDPEAVEVEVEQVLGTDFNGWSHGCFSRAAPADLLVLLGSYNQRVYVVPSLDLVVVRQGKSTDFKDAEFLRLLFGPSQ